MKCTIDASTLRVVESRGSYYVFILIILWMKWNTRLAFISEEEVHVVYDSLRISIHDMIISTLFMILHHFKNNNIFMYLW